MTTDTKQPAYQMTSRRDFWGEIAVFIGALTILGLYYVYRFTIQHITWPDMIIQYNDQWHFDVMARSLLGGNGFSNPAFGLRPPLHPLVLAALYALFGAFPTIAVLFNLVVGALIVSVTYKLSVLLLRDKRIALIAALALAVDVAHLTISATIMSEPLHDLLLLMSLYWLIRFLRTSRWAHVLASAVCITLALLERPTAVYFPFLMTLIVIIYRTRLWRQALAISAIAILAIAGWSFRGLYYRDNFSFSTSSTFTMLFYRTVAIESHATGISNHQAAVDIKLELERRLGHTQYTAADFEEDPVGRFEDIFTADARREAVSRQIFVTSVEKYPQWMILLTIAHFLTQFSADKPAIVILPPTIQLGITGLELALAVVGAVCAIREKRRELLLIGGAVFLYYAGITALTVSFTPTRYRTPYWPIILIFASYGALAAVNWFREIRRRVPSRTG